MAQAVIVRGFQRAESRDLTLVSGASVAAVSLADGSGGGAGHHSAEGRGGCGPTEGWVSLSKGLPPLSMLPLSLRGEHVHRHCPCPQVPTTQNPSVPALPASTWPCSDFSLLGRRPVRLEVGRP